MHAHIVYCNMENSDGNPKSTSPWQQNKPRIESPIVGTLNIQ